MPGVLILESMAQAGAFLVLNSVENPLDKNMFFTGVSDSKIRAPVTPGDQLRLEMTLVKMKLNAIRLKGEGYVENKLVQELGPKPLSQYVLISILKFSDLYSIWRVCNKL